jgi:small subunit ribosomal protein S8
MTDPIADLFTRLNNAKLAGREQTKVPYSKFKTLLLQALKEEGFIGSFSENKGAGEILVEFGSKSRHFERIKVISKPGSKIYTRKNKIPRSKGGFGTVLISTPKGVMTDAKARKAGIGGEVVCEVY